MHRVDLHPVYKIMIWKELIVFDQLTVAFANDRAVFRAERIDGNRLILRAGLLLIDLP